VNRGQGKSSAGKGLVFVVSAPSGGGKTTVLSRVMEELPGLRFSVSYTTRPPRSGEQEGRDYYFVTQDRFRNMVAHGEFLEWAEVLGNRYGTANIDLAALESEGVDLILDIDTQGAKTIRRKAEDPVFVFILPPSPGVLETRLVNRGLDAPDTIRFRLSKARQEIAEAYWYDYIIINERLDEAVGQLNAIIVAERCRRCKQEILGKEVRLWEDKYGADHR
jgi:guanylate kinase